MATKTQLIIDGVALDLLRLRQLQERPAPFEPGESLFWDDPHISQEMLASHLFPKANAASRRPQVIDREVAWVIEQMQLQEGQPVLDLGCGPGLYAARLAEHGLHVTGIDYAHRSIDTARAHARQHKLEITYVLADYLEMDYDATFEAAMIINGDFTMHSPAERGTLLRNVHRALKVGGCLALDVVTHRFRDSFAISNQWYVAETGFWRSGRHLVLEERFEYPKQALFLNQYIIIEADGTATVYRNWFQTFTAETLAAELEAHGFAIDHIGGDLRGNALTDSSEWIGVVAHKIA